MVAANIPSATAFTALDQVVHRVKEGSRAFARLSLDDRMQLAEQMRQGYREISERSVIEACQAKGIDFNSSLSGEEWLVGPLAVLRNLRLILESLREIKEYGAPRIHPKWISQLPDGRISVKVYPTSTLDAALLAKTTCEVHMQPGVTAQNLKEHQASFYRRPHDGRLCVVLGAGNVNGIPPTDVIFKMFVEGCACILKVNPVNGYMGPLLERAFRAPIERGYLAVVYGGAEEGSHLINHALVDEVHITGSDKTHELMVWGPPGPDREARKRRNDPLLKKHITSELGNVSPVAVVPGPYSASELEFQGRSIAGMVTNNASFNCTAAKVLVTQQGWQLEGALLEQIQRGMGTVAARKAYYPGAEQRWKRLTEGRPGLKLIGNPKEGELAYAFIPNVDPERTDDRVFTEEPWCTVISQTALPASDTVAYLERMVTFLNEKVWGTLAANVIIHPSSLKDPAVAAALEKAIRDLKYGTVAINTWSAVGFALMSTPWGGHPSSTPQNIQSGVGFVHNTFMLEQIEKCVVRAPVKAMPVSPWFPAHRTQDVLGRRLTEMEWSPSWLKLPGVAAAALGA